MLKVLQTPGNLNSQESEIFLFLIYFKKSFSNSQAAALCAPQF